MGLVVPTLLTWPGSVIAHDIKGENWTLTAGWRARFGRVLLFDPTNAASAAYNPLMEVRRGEREVRDVQNIADVLVDPEGALERINDWSFDRFDQALSATLDINQAAFDAAVRNGLAEFDRFDLKFSAMAAAIAVLIFLGVAARIREYE